MLKIAGSQVNYPHRLITFDNLTENADKVSEEIRINWGDCLTFSLSTRDL